MQEPVEGFPWEALYNGFILFTKLIGGTAAVVKGIQVFINYLQQCKEYFQETPEQEYRRLKEELPVLRKKRDDYRKQSEKEGILFFRDVSVEEKLLQSKINKMKVRIDELEGELGLKQNSCTVM